MISTDLKALPPLHFLSLTGHILTTQIPIIASYFSLENYAEPRSPSRMHSVWTWYDMNTTKKRRTVRFLPCGVPRDQIAKLGIPQKKDNYSSNKQDNSDEWRRIRAISIDCNTIRRLGTAIGIKRIHQEEGYHPCGKRHTPGTVYTLDFFVLVLDTCCHLIKINTAHS